jgi:two-component system sensor histidine kinase DevS
MKENNTLQLQSRLAGLHRYCLSIIKATSIKSLLEEIAIAACRQGEAGISSVNLIEINTNRTQAVTVRNKDGITTAIDGGDLFNIWTSHFDKETDTVRFPGNGSLWDIQVLNSEVNEITSFLYVPILMGSLLIGQIFLVNKIGGSEFSIEDQKVIETLSAYAALAIADADLHDRLSQRDQILMRRNDNLAMLNDLASTLSSLTDIDLMMKQVVDLLMQHLHLEAAEIFLHKEDSNILQLALHSGADMDCFWEKTHFVIGEGIVGTAASTAQPLLINLTKDENPYDLQDCMMSGHFHQLVCLPMGGINNPLGVLCIATSQPQPLDDLELHFLSIISSWVGTVIENARLNMQQRRIAVLEERERIGRELHDGIIQSIYAVGLILEHVRLLMHDDPQRADQRIEQAIADLNVTIRDLRLYILDLQPYQLFEENLVIGIQRLVKGFLANTLVEVSFNANPDDFKDLSVTHALTLFQICQESLANAAKHARATRVDVSLWTSADRALLEVHDNGRGFDTSYIKQSLGHGLSNMQTRAHNAGGDVDIISEPGMGTTIMAWVPFHKKSSTSTAEPVSIQKANKEA